MISFLKNINDGSVFYLVNKEQFIVGRKDCDFLISNDQSISRKHAVIQIKDGKITVEDYGSKYSTTYNGKKIEPNTEKILNKNDEIQFGVINSKYRLEQHKIITTGTRINSTQKAQLKSDLDTIGGRYVENWTSDCTHLTVEEITLTVKVLHAIIDGIPIVKPTYWTKYAENIRKNLPPPVIDKYNKPPIAETLLNNIEFKSDPNRKTLFKGKLFVFTKENNKKQMEEIIRKAGGTSISWEKDPMPLEDIKKSPKEFIIIQTSDATEDATDNPDLNEVIKHFSKRGKRTIPLQEIATAIVLCCCEKNCNPNFNRVEKVFPVSQPNEPTQNNALVLGTQSQYFTATRYQDEEDDVQMIIPDTIESESIHFKEEPRDKISRRNVTGLQSLKRQTDNDLDEKPIKKAKVENAGTSRKSNKCDSVKQETKDIFWTKSKTSQTKSVEQDEQSTSINSSKIEGEKNPFLKQGKINIKKSNKNHNPFQSIKDSINDKSQLNAENPFMSSGKKKRRSDDDIDISVSKKKKDEIFSSTRLSNISGTSSKFAKTPKINWGNNSLWYSKNTTTNVTTDFKENIENSFDLEMQNFIDQFKDTVVVENITELPKRSRIFHDVVDGQNSSKKHNFKRFVKVMPIRPQRIIIGKDNCVAVGPRDTTGIEDTRREHHFSDDEANDSRKPKKKAPKKFFI